MSRKETLFAIEKTESNIGYGITPYSRIYTGAIWQLGTREYPNSTRVQLITHPGYQVQTEAVNGLGYFLRLLPNDELDICLASPDLGDDNPIITSGEGTIVCWIAAADSQQVFAVEGTDCGSKFHPSYEKRIPSGRDIAQILKSGGRERHLHEFWQAYHILTTQPLDFVRQFYPQLQPAYDLLLNKT